MDPRNETDRIFEGLVLDDFLFSSRPHNRCLVFLERSPRREKRLGKFLDLEIFEKFKLAKGDASSQGAIKRLEGEFC